MSDKAVLLDLENNTPTVQLFREIVQHYPVVYVFNATGKFEFALDDLTEFSSWVSSGQIIILESVKAEYKEYEYAMLVGQLIALLDDGTHIEIISAMDESHVLLELLQSSNISAHLIQIQTQEQPVTPAVKFSLPSVSTIKQQPQLQLVKQYCDALVKMTGKPNTIEKLKNSLVNVLQLVPEKASNLVGMLINLKLVKSYDEHIHFRKKVLKQWVQLNLNEEQDLVPKAKNLQDAVAHLEVDKTTSHAKPAEPVSKIQAAQQDLFKNFAKIDAVQVEVARRLRELKDQKPKDIYALRDLLEQMFPKADIRLLLKELIEKGYIYWNGHEVIYSHEMFLN
jgi:hypothetical protein